MASELEFYVFNEPFESAREKVYRNLKTAGWYIEDSTSSRPPRRRA